MCTRSFLSHLNACHRGQRSTGGRERLQVSTRLVSAVWLTCCALLFPGTSWCERYTFCTCAGNTREVKLVISLSLKINLSKLNNKMQFLVDIQVSSLHNIFCSPQVAHAMHIMESYSASIPASRNFFTISRDARTKLGVARDTRNGQETQITAHGKEMS